MQEINYPNRQQWAELLSRPKPQVQTRMQEAADLLASIRDGGDDALLFFAQEQSRQPVEQLALTNYEIQQAAQALSPEIQSAIHQARARLEKFHFMQTEIHRKLEMAEGIYAWRDTHPLASVGIFVDDNGAEGLSQLLMYAVPALVAGCKELVLCASPSSDAQLSHGLVWTASMLGIRQVWKLDGAQAFAAMALGTQAIPKVSKLFGCGDELAAAMKLTLTGLGYLVDMPTTLSGASDLVIIADAHSQARQIAFEAVQHNRLNRRGKVIIFVDQEEVRDAIAAEVRAKTAFLPTPPSRPGQPKGFPNYLALVKNPENTINFTNQFAPDDLWIATCNATAVAKQIQAAGAVFLGHDLPLTAARYLSGLSDIGPGMGRAQQTSSLSVEQFIRKVSFVRMDEQASLEATKLAVHIAQAEGHTDAHRSLAEMARRIEHPYGW